MAQVQSKKGAPLNRVPSDQDVVTLTQAQLNQMISNAVTAAITAASVQQQNHARQEETRTMSSRTRLEVDFNNRLLENNHLAKIIDEEETEMFAIPKIYESYVGCVTASINGQTIKIPADGVKRRIPVRFIPIIMQYLENTDKKVATMNATNGQYGGVTEIKGGAF